MARLDRYWDGKLAGSVILRQRDYLVGREPDCDVILQDKLASRRHFQILWNDEGYFVLKDLQTSNGTLVDGTFIKKHILRGGEEIIVGGTMLQYIPLPADNSGGRGVCKPSRGDGVISPLTPLEA